MNGEIGVTIATVAPAAADYAPNSTGAQKTSEKMGKNKHYFSVQGSITNRSKAPLRITTLVLTSDTIKIESSFASETTTYTFNPSNKAVTTRTEYKEIPPGETLPFEARLDSDRTDVLVLSIDLVLEHEAARSLGSYRVRVPQPGGR